MGTSKTNLFKPETNRLALQLKALAHPARVAIIEHLAEQQGCINQDLVKELGLAQATVSQHLKELKNAEIIKGEIEENKMCYCLDDNVAQKLLSHLSTLLTSKQKTNCL